MTARVFVPLQSRLRKRRAPELRAICECLRFDRPENIVGNSDVTDLDRAAMQPAWQQKVARLAPKERYGAGRVDRGPHDCAARSIYPAWQVNGDDGDALAVHRADHRPGQSVDIAIETCPKQRVNDEIATGKFGRRGLLNRPRPLFGSERRISLQPRPLTDKTNTHDVAARRQIAGGNEPVTAVIAGTGHDHDAAALNCPASDIGDRTPGVLHQCDAG